MYVAKTQQESILEVSWPILKHWRGSRGSVTVTNVWGTQIFWGL